MYNMYSMYMNNMYMNNMYMNNMYNMKSALSIFMGKGYHYNDREIMERSILYGVKFM